MLMVREVPLPPQPASSAAIAKATKARYLMVRPAEVAYGAAYADGPSKYFHCVPNGYNKQIEKPSLSGGPVGWDTREYRVGID